MLPMVSLPYIKEWFINHLGIKNQFLVLMFDLFKKELLFYPPHRKRNEFEEMFSPSVQVRHVAILVAWWLAG